MHLIKYHVWQVFNLLRVSALACHPQVIFQIKEIQGQQAIIGMHCTHLNDQNIKILKYI